jgi:hypothetical protein
MGGGPRFDPMLEERGGWVAGEGLKGDTMMSEVSLRYWLKPISRFHETNLIHLKSNMVRYYPRILKETLVVF